MPQDAGGSPFVTPICSSLRQVESHQSVETRFVAERRRPACFAGKGQSV